MTNDPTRATSESEVLRTLLVRRRSCRAFHSGPVPNNLIEDLLQLAGRSPSWCNTQPWHVVVTDQQETELFRDSLAAHIQSGAQMDPDFPFPQRYSGVYDVRRKAAGWQLYDSVGVTRGDRTGSARQAARNFEFFGAPHVAIVTTEAELGTYGVLDCGIYVSTFLLAAESFGLGAIAQAALASYPAFMREHFGLSSTRRVVCGISFGWPDKTHPANSFRTSRAPVGETTTWTSGGILTRSALTEPTILSMNKEG